MPTGSYSPKIAYVLTGIALSCDVDISALEAKRSHEVLPKAHEVLCHIVLVVYCDIARRKSSRNWLVNPHLDPLAGSVVLGVSMPTMLVRLVQE